MSDVAFRSAVEQLRALASGEVSSQGLVELYLERIATHNTALNAVITVDAERARREARAADAARAAGQDLGPLHGVPITVKDSFETAGMRTVCGRRDLRDHVPEQDAEAVKRLRSAGAVIMGKSNMPPGNQDVQADNPVFGPSSNPWDTTRTSGGSAGGGAVATAAGLAAFDFGSEIGGSTRIPSHYTGLYGHKSTWRSIPLIGHVPNGPGAGRWTEADMACGGAQVRDARDLVPILQATVGTADYDDGFSYTLAPPRATRLADFRVAVWSEDPSCPVDSDVAGAVDDVLTVLRSAGAKVVVQPAGLPADIATNQQAFLPLVYGAFTYDRTGLTPAPNAALLARLVQNPRGDAGPALRGTFQSHYQWLKAHTMRNELRQRWFEFFQDFDIVLMPVAPTAAPAHHNKLIDRFGRSYEVEGVRRPYWDQVKWNAVANISGSPATTIPVRRGRSGLPIGLQAMGPGGGDLTTIEFAALLGREVEGFVPPPAFR
ncbi:amidase [Streptomyces sp. NBC_00120]|uniref:amidase n=1 Tax=unclassified Streptomyces TaxID=2593676 RepID=UPI00224DC711|nr:amidase [Streptomyces sp. NBC_00120]MCX5319955.1 amidase [Streptomyces sp. NBC_00120]